MDQTWKLTGTTLDGIRVEIVTRHTGTIDSFTPPTGYLESLPYVLDGFDELDPEGEDFATTSGRRPQITYKKATELGTAVGSLRPYLTFNGYEILRSNRSRLSPEPIGSARDQQF